MTLLALVAVAAVPLLMWPRDDVPRDPDAVVVLGGAGPERADLGIELSERYDATLVLSSSASIFGRRRGVVCGEDALCFEPDPTTTTGEARNVAQFAEEYGWEHVTVATSRFHTTRSRVLFRQCLGDRVTVVGTPPAGGVSFSLRRDLREAVGTLAALTVRRAC